MVGFYNYTVWLTYVSLLSGGVGIYFTFTKHPYLASIMLAVCGICDMFDGKIARTKKDRTQEEKQFGIEIDSLTDLVCFGVLPACIAYCVIPKELRVYFAPLLSLFILAGMIRLAYYNVLEHNKSPETKSCFYGFPITTSAIVCPLLMLFHPLIGMEYFFIPYTILIGVLMVAYVVKIKLPKPNTKTSIFMLVVLMLIFITILVIEVIMRRNGALG